VFAHWLGFVCVLGVLFVCEDVCEWRVRRAFHSSEREGGGIFRLSGGGIFEGHEILLMDADLIVLVGCRVRGHGFVVSKP